MNHLHLLISDLFLPQDVAQKVCSGIHLPVLEKLLARSQRSGSPAATLEEILCHVSGAKAIAPMRAVADGLDVDTGFWLCADPVSIQLQQSQMVLQPDVQCDAAEATALINSLNAHFAEVGLAFFAPALQRWYVRCSVATSVTMTPLRLAVGLDVKTFQPQGTDALHWQSISNEIQMLLHEHAVNLAREEKGLLPINSLWLWGAGQSTVLHPSIDTIGGDDALSATFARAADIPLASSLEDMLGGKGRQGLWVDDTPGQTLRRGDFYAWREAIEKVESEIAAPVWQAMRNGNLQAVTIDVSMESATRRFELTTNDLWKVWRISKPLATYHV